MNGKSSEKTVAERNAYAKINLTLEITGRRSDGYHELRTIMQKITLCDTLVFELDFAGSGRIDLFCDKDLCPIKDNLAYRAAESYLLRYREKTGKSFDLSITLKKRIPAAAGLAGGSADSACVLDFLCETAGGLTRKETALLAAMLGSDVPFCFDRCACALCAGRGGELTPCAPLFSGSLVVCKPDVSMKTSDMYASFDAAGTFSSGEISELVRGLLDAGKEADAYPHFQNDFETVSFSKCPEIAAIREDMLRGGAKTAHLSGSGSAVYGVFERKDEAEAVQSSLEKNGRTCSVCGFFSGNSERT